MRRRSEKSKRGYRTALARLQKRFGCCAELHSAHRSQSLYDGFMVGMARAFWSDMMEWMVETVRDINWRSLVLALG
jgi:hypothetical protein